MRKWTTYIVIALTFCVQEPFSQLLRLPLLAVHFLDHVQRNPQTGVLEFMKMHYWGKDIADKDDSQDANLPFKCQDSHHVAFVFNLPVKSSGITISEIPRVRKFLFYEVEEHSGYPRSLIHPPSI